MTREGDRPRVAAAGDALGVRVSPDPTPDVHPDEHGIVSPVPGPRGEGMSVAPDWRALPPHRIPRRLKHIARGACGKNALFCWSTGSGPFAPAVIADGLRLRPDEDKTTHGVIEPAAPMHRMRTAPPRRARRR